MIFVLSIFGIFLFYSIFFTEDIYEKQILIMPLSILILFTGSRINVGGYDYHVYKYFYELPYFQNPYGYEKLFLILKDFSKFIGLDYNYFLFFLSLIFNFIIYKIFITYSMYPTLSFLIYLSTFYYWHNFTIIRNFISILIFWISLKYILQRKLIIYFCLITIACLFHKTAIILYPLYFFLNYKQTKNSLIYLLGMGVIINPISYLIFKLNINFLGLSERLNRYSHIIESGNFYEFSELFIIVFISLFFIKIADSKENLFINLNIFALFIFISFYRFAIILRFLEYFRVGIFITIPFILSRIENKFIRNLLFITLLLYLTFKYYDTVTAYAIYNYNTWLI
ncbi:EpsG family protein [Cetobacterium sp. ZOR0034]|uniref:EpsG family protein n=2 Tax=unclassified Cetobacterium TaxID=2630983 RepID=UPI0006482978|nr:EpsG family protein [Cetobacterium sp. ZOR0034]